MVWIIWFDTGLSGEDGMDHMVLYRSSVKDGMDHMVWYRSSVKDGMDHMVSYKSFSWGWYGSYGLIQVFSWGWYGSHGCIQVFSWGWYGSYGLIQVFSWWWYGSYGFMYTGLLVEDGMDHMVLILYRSFSWGWFGSYGLIQVCIVRCGMDHIVLYWSVFLGCVTWTCIAHNNDTNAKKILPLLYPVRSICIPGISRLQRSTSENVGGLELCQS